jgi:hypothetical protein
MAHFGFHFTVFIVRQHVILRLMILTMPTTIGTSIKTLLKEITTLLRQALQKGMSSCFLTTWGADQD